MSTWYCPLPFRHTYVDSTGVSACCQTPRYPVTLDQWSEYPQLKNLQQQLLAGQQPQQCHTCVSSESLQGRSLRTDANHDYDHKVFTDTLIDFVDFRSTNICNFKCRSCFPRFSHGISQEANKFPELKKYFDLIPADKTASVSDNNVDWIMRNLTNLKRIMFTGGEPTVIPGVRELIKKIQRDHPHITVLITSNASFEDNFWFDITRQLPNLHWTVSIDVVGSSAEIVRHGSDWNVIEHNVTWLARNATSLDINSVVSNLTLFGLKPLLKFGRDMQRMSMSPSGRHGDLGCRHQFFVCKRPYWLTADNWPPEYKIRALDYLQSCQLLDLDSEQQNMIMGLRASLESSVFDVNLWEYTQNYNQVLNRIRNENHMDLYQEQL
jgi:sulfatase maturation enzyme AslB (radical SAM superfamily)